MIAQKLRLLLSPRQLPAVIVLLYSALAVSLTSNQYTAVDGALRCLVVYWHRTPYVGPNNHLLYPASVWMWSQAAAAVGISARNPISFIHLTAALNAVCAAGSVAVVNALVRRLTGDWKAALIAAAFFAFSWALLVHATSSAEPVPGLFVSLVAALLTIEGLSSGHRAALFAGGMCMAWALASYESMFLIAPLLYLLCLVWPTGGNNRDNVSRSSALGRALVSILGTITGVAAIYGTAYYSIGITNPAAMLQSMFRLGGEPEVYGTFSIAKIVNFLPGLAGNLMGILPENYRGIRWLLSNQNRVLAAASMGLLALLACVLVVLAGMVVEQCRRGQSRTLCAVCCAGLLFEFFPLLYWDPMYNKLWLQPIAVSAVLGGVLASQMNIRSAKRLGSVVLLLIALEVGINLPRLAIAHLEPTRCIDDAQIARKLVRSNDKVVTDFDPVSSLWMGLYDSHPGRTLLFPAVPAVISLATLDRWSAECKRSGCRIAFLALLDQPRNVWDSFLGKRLRINYNSLELYRRSSRIIHQFSCEDGSLRVYDPPAGRVPLR